MCCRLNEQQVGGWDLRFFLVSADIPSQILIKSCIINHHESSWHHHHCDSKLFLLMVRFHEESHRPSSLNFKTRTYTLDQID
jgi:hypothetical protein